MFKKGTKIEKLTIIELVPKEDRPNQNHGNYWLCQCECGNYVKVPTAYLTGNGNYKQTSCGCDRKKKAFQVSSNIGVDENFLKQFSTDFERYMFIHKALIRTSGNSAQWFKNNIQEYKKYILYFWNDKQFNMIYDFWKLKEGKDPTYYDWAKPSLDHIIPKSRGGTNDYDNLQFLTTFENLSKRDMTQQEWDNFKKTTNTKSDYFIDNIMANHIGGDL